MLFSAPCGLDILPAMSCPSTGTDGVPQRSAGQRREALASANRVRAQRAMLKADLKEGSVSIVALISEPPEYLASARVMEVLLALPGCGRVRAARLLEDCRVSPRKTVRGLSARQRRELLRALEH
jgi:hypothetical protein